MLVVSFLPHYIIQEPWGSPFTHMHMDRSTGNTDLLDMAFTSSNLAKHYIQFQIGDDLGSDHLPIKISIDAPPHRNSSANHTKYKFDQTDREVF